MTSALDRFLYQTEQLELFPSTLDQPAAMPVTTFYYGDPDNDDYSTRYDEAAHTAAHCDELDDFEDEVPIRRVPRLWPGRRSTRLRS